MKDISLLICSIFWCWEMLCEQEVAYYTPTEMDDAYWRYPNGIRGEGIEDKMNHSVTCIAYKDIEVYCEWANV